MIVRFMVRPATALAALLAMGIANPSLAGSFYDYAQVLECTPVLTHERVPVRHAAACPAQDSSLPEEEAGWLHERNPQLRLTDWIERDAARRAAPAAACRERIDFEILERVVAYNVRYRYGGTEYLRRLDHDPGPRLRVRVDIKAP